MSIDAKKVFPINNPQNPATGIFLKNLESIYGTAENKNIKLIEPFVYIGTLVGSGLEVYNENVFYVGLEIIFGGENVELQNIVPDVHLHGVGDVFKMHLSNSSAHEEDPPPVPNTKFTANYIKVENLDFYRLIFTGYETFSFIGFKVTLE